MCFVFNFRHQGKKQRGIYKSSGCSCIYKWKNINSRQQQPVCTGMPLSSICLVFFFPIPLPYLFSDFVQHNARMPKLLIVYCHSILLTCSYLVQLYTVSNMYVRVYFHSFLCLAVNEESRQCNNLEKCLFVNIASHCKFIS